jgi:hypothetical protein
MWLARLGIAFVIALFIALMLGGVVPAVFPQLAKLAAPVVCSSNEQMTVTSDTYYPQPGRTVTSNHWFCVREDGTQRSVDMVALLVCGAYVFLPMFILMIFKVKPVSSSPITTAVLGSPTSGLSAQNASVSENQRSFAERLSDLTQAHEAKLITDEEFEKKKREILNAL